MAKTHPTSISGPIELLFVEHELHENLCDCLEEIALFPLLHKYSTDYDNMAEIIERWKQEHIIDEGNIGYPR